MKELSIEEKAKRYDEAIKKLCSLHDDYDTVSTLIDVKEELENIFPELKESENERIRKIISDILLIDSDEIREILDDNNVLMQDVYAWFEKQGVSKSYWKPTEEQYEALTYDCNSCSDTERGNYYEGVLESLIEDLHRLDEQHSKFRIGDTIKKKSTGDIATISMIDLKNREYRLSNTGFIPFKYEHLWELVEIEQYKPNITIGTKIRSKANPDVILTIISDDCHEDEFECSNGSVLSLKQIEKYYERID